MRVTMKGESERGVGTCGAGARNRRASQSVWEGSQAIAYVTAVLPPVAAAASTASSLAVSVKVALSGPRLVNTSRGGSKCTPVACSRV